MTEQSKVRVAMIGAGGMANNVHYPSLASFADVEIAAICDIDSQRLTTTADKYNVQKRYSDYRKMVEEIAPDAVYAIGQPHMMAHLAAEQQCITQVSFQRRSCPMVVQLYNECRKRGPIVHAECSFFKCEPRPYLEARDHMMDDGVHAIDTLRWLCGGEVVAVQSHCKRIGTPDINFISALLHFDNGATGVLLNSWTSGRRIFKVEIHAPGICAEAEHENKGRLYADGDIKGIEFDTRTVSGSNENYIFGGFQAKNREFIDAVKNKTLPSSHFGDAIKTMEVAEIILAQTLLKK